MPLGRWFSSTVIAILVTFLPFILVFLVQLDFQDIVDSLRRLTLASITLLVFFGVISLAGWCCFGWPTHYLSCRYGQGRVIWYLLAVAVFFIAMTLYSGLNVAIFFSVFALAQALVFRWRVFRN